MPDRTYAALTIPVQFRELAAFIAKETNEAFDEISEDDGVVVFVREDANRGDMPVFEQGLAEHYVPYDLRWEAGSEYGAGGRQLRVRRNPDGVLECVKHEYFDASGLIGAGLVAELIDTGATTELRRLASNAISVGAPIDADIEDAPFLEDHRAALEEFRRASRSAD